MYQIKNGDKVIAQNLLKVSDAISKLTDILKLEPENKKKIIEKKLAALLKKPIKDNDFLLIEFNKIIFKELNLTIINEYTYPKFKVGDEVWVKESKKLAEIIEVIYSETPGYIVENPNGMFLALEGNLENP